MDRKSPWDAKDRKQIHSHVVKPRDWTEILMMKSLEDDDLIYIVQSHQLILQEKMSLFKYTWQPILLSL